MLDNKDTTTPIIDDTIMIRPATRRSIWNNILLVVAIALGLYTMIAVATNVTGDNIQTFEEILSSISWDILTPVLIAIVLAMVCDIAKYHIVTCTMMGKGNLLTSIKVAFVGKYYDNVTPFHTGGQPMQMLYLHKKGLEPGDASAIITAKFFANTLAWLLIGCALLCNVGALSTLDSSTRLILLIGGWLGVLVHASVPAVLLLFIIAPKFTEKLLGLIVRVGSKLKLIKDAEATLDKYVTNVNRYKTSLKRLSRYRARAVLLVLLCMIEPLITYSLPYLLMMSLPCGIETSYSMLFTVTTINAFACFAVMIVPTPGNSGVIEWITSIAFASIASGVLFWVVFLWRFFVYYIYIIIGLLLTVYELIRNSIRNKRAKTTIK